jgi:hypothetical protein
MNNLENPFTFIKLPLKILLTCLKLKKNMQNKLEPQETRHNEAIKVHKWKRFSKNSSPLKIPKMKLNFFRIKLV